MNRDRQNNTHAAQMQRQLLDSQVACRTLQCLERQQEIQLQRQIAMDADQRQRSLMDHQHDLEMRRLAAGAAQAGYTNAGSNSGLRTVFEFAGLPLANYAANHSVSTNAGATTPAMNPQIPRTMMNNTETRLTLPLRQGMRVVVEGLTAAHYNSQLGTLESRNANGDRWTVRLDGNDNNQLAVRPQNLTALQNLRVGIHGLTSGSYNGRTGTIQDRNANGERWIVKLDGAGDTQVALRDQNLTLISFS